MLVVRIFLYLVLGIIVWYLIKRLWRGTSQASPKSYQRMVRCAYCGLHIPQSEALAQGKTFFCCETHQQLFRKET